MIEIMKKKILYIEDDPNHQFAMELLLAGKYQLISVSDGKDGIKTALEIMPDLIIVDILLHKSSIDGHTIIQSVRAYPRLVGVPIIAITGHTGEIEKTKCFEEGCDGFFSKPLNVDTFSGEISRFIGE